MERIRTASLSARVLFVITLIVLFSLLIKETLIIAGQSFSILA